ncbi:DUF4181 domain-containing protein [Virgibacillus sp. MSP4-1]|uniref:DUF4181 domain-containing protein n=1 Tax=Virgibacillus sp. MSP4-1 TaxID=2700081 RepID=UPI0005C6B78C|nr:DUF4181 domain-containing protein [Virgibacillus sp. MSP4-1]QHS21787.1 DUF4181 domain-containing protein [Virgibacillus sp. MSP4-1]
MKIITVIGLIVIFFIYLFVDQYLLKRKLGIKTKKFWLFSENRKTYAIVIDIVIMILFVISYWILNTGENVLKYSAIVRTGPLFGLFFLLFLNRGIEEIRIHPTEKSYYHSWLGSLLILSAFIVILIFE